MQTFSGLFNRSRALVSTINFNRAGGASSSAISQGGGAVSQSSSGGSVGGIFGGRSTVSFSVITKSDNSLYIKNGNTSAKISNDAPSALKVLEQTFSKKNQPNNVIQIKSTTAITNKGVITAKFGQALKSKINNIAGIVVKN